MFDQKINMPDNSELTPLEPQSPLAGDLPISNQPKVTPKFNSTAIPGAQDMFAEADDNDGAATLPGMPAFKNISQPVVMPNLSAVGPQEPLSELPDDADAEPDGKKKYIWIGAAVLAILILGGGYFAYSKFLAGSIKAPDLNLNISPEEFNKQLQQEVTNLNLNQDNPDITNVNGDANNNTNQDVNLNLNSGDNGNVNVDSSLDSDQDSLTDQEEAALGTDPNSTDTDGDGLFDYEEVRTYHTEPLNPDTDGDGYTDGQEVHGGYNPNGPGKALEANFN